MFISIFSIAQNKSDYFSFLLDSKKVLLYNNEDSAILLLLKSLEFNPYSSVANYSLAKIYFNQNNKTLALNYAEKAYRIDSSCYWYKILLFNIYTSLYDKTRANIILNTIIYNSYDKNDFFQALNYSDSINDSIFFFKTLNLYENRFDKDKMFFQTIIPYYLHINDTVNSLKYSFEYFKSSKSSLDPLNTLLSTFLYFHDYDSVMYYKSKYYSKYSYDFTFNLLISELYSQKFKLSNKSLYIDSSLFYFKRSLNCINVNSNEIITFLFNNSFLYNPLILHSNFDNIIHLIFKNNKTNTYFISYIADIYQKYNKFNKALNFYYLFLQINYTNFDIYFKTFSLLNRLEKWNDLDSLTNVALNFYPLVPEVYLFRGISLLNLNFYQEALSNLEYGLNITYSNTFLESHFNFYLSEYYRLTNAPLKSQNFFDSALELAQNEPDLLANFAFYYARHNVCIDTALNLITKCIIKNTDDLSSSLAYIYAYILFKINDLNTALSYVNYAIELTEFDNYFYFYLKAQILGKLGNSTEAELFYKLAKENEN